MAKSPTAIAAAKSDKDTRDANHTATLAAEGDRKRREPTGGNQPAPGSQPKL